MLTEQLFLCLKGLNWCTKFLYCFRKKDKKFISRLLAQIECKGKSILGWKLPYYLFNLNWLIFYVLCNSRYWNTVIERYLAFCWENLFSILLAFCSKNASAERPCKFVDRFSKLRCLKRKSRVRKREWMIYELLVTEPFIRQKLLKKDQFCHFDDPQLWLVSNNFSDMAQKWEDLV